ncbi:MAG: hypothetical protein RBU37_12555 [Myxococcota bacterium]|jgi:hypothetical protein|nr:hypothetical protein [Myxococcota bacterium]
MHRLQCCLLVVVGAASLFACDDEAPTPELVEPLLPISVDRNVRGIGVFPGDEAVIRSQDWAQLAEGVSHLVIRAQLVDELLVSREGETAVPAAMFAPRVESIRSNVSAVQPFDKYVAVLDLYRLSDGSKSTAPQPYLTTWDRNEREIERYGFWRSDYRDAVLAQVEALMQADEKPAIFIFGAEVHRYLDMAGGADDFANLVSLYRDAYASIKAVAPQVRVGVGIDWIRFRADIVPKQRLKRSALPPELVVEGDELDCAALPEQDRDLLEQLCVQQAFSLYVEPFLQYLDPQQDAPIEGELWEPRYVKTAELLTLSAVPKQSDFGNVPANCPEDFFAPLIEWSKRFPIAYYQVGWQMASSVSVGKHAEWYSVLVERNLGVNVELIAWAQTKDLLDNDCGKLSNDLGAPVWLCNAGLWSASTAPKSVAELFFSDIQP